MAPAGFQQLRQLARTGHRIVAPGREREIRMFKSDDIRFWRNHDNPESGRDHLQRAGILSPFLNSNMRTLKSVTDRAISELECIRADMPNFAEVLDFISTEMKASYMKWYQPFELPPLLLTGGPGVGKTEFCRRLAQAVDVPVGTVVCSSASSPWVLQGLAFGYSGGHMGAVANLLMRNPFANGLILLDELDKAPFSSDKGSLVDPLYELLESDSARSFTDSFLERPIDASYLAWICTANDESQIAKPLLQRMHVFEIAQPSGEQLPEIVRAVAAHWIDHFSGHGVVFEEVSEITDDVIQSYAHMAPREIKLAMREAMTTAVAQSYPGLVTGVLSVPPAPKDHELMAGASGIGFQAVVR